MTSDRVRGKGDVHIIRHDDNERNWKHSMTDYPSGQERAIPSLPRCVSDAVGEGAGGGGEAKEKGGDQKVTVKESRRGSMPFCRGENGS